MGNRASLNTILLSILGSSHVYFQPPENIKLIYPCIVYSLDKIQVLRASNVLYKKDRRYSLTVIGRDSDTVILDRILALETAVFDRQYISDGLIHDVFTLYY